MKTWPSAWILGAAIFLLSACTGDRTGGSETPSPSGSPVGTVPSRSAAWSALPDASSARQEVAAMLVGDEVFVAGGFDEARAASRRIDVFNIRTSSWRAGPPLPEGRHHPAGAVYRGQAYLIGGYGPDGKPSAAVFRLDGDHWVRVAELNRPRAAAAAVVTNDRLYVFGGEGVGALLARPEVFEPDATSRWRDLAPMPTLRHHLAADASAQFVYVAGGRAPRDGKTVNVTAFERYDVSQDSWESLPDLPAGRSGHGAAVVDDRLVLIGGEDPDTGGPSIARVDAYSLLDKTWSSLPPMPRPRHGVAVIANEGRIYVFLGASQAGFDATRQSDVLALE